MKRLKKVMKKMEEKGIESFYVTNEKNVRYLTKFTGEESVLLILRDEAFFITDGRYTEQAKTELPDEIQIVRWTKGLMNEAIERINKSNIRNVYFEGDQMNYTDAVVFIEGVKVEAKPVSGFVEEFRSVKDEEEIASTIEAVKIADKTFFHILNFIRPGVSEKEVANEMEYYMKKIGSEGTSFPTIVASGIRSSFPHATASDKIIERGDIVTLDFGALYNGYASDITRTIAVGKVDPKLDEIYYLVLEAEIAGLEAIRAGMSAKELDAIIRCPIKEKDMNQYFNHGGGHSIGLDIHEAPFIGNSPDVFRANNIQTIEPGVYLPGLGGVRIEDDILVQDGPGIVLTSSPKKDLITLPFY
ncbi:MULTISPECIES: M24 family metallopeptidase [Heyndrickxia]|uniref:M24 family metallopeptidase n=1 Tax=Heyndrickxia TaxID=2837504 RepID=UPI002DC0001E|nr:aminopeptidase P family protein [Weizmannia sp. CD-2023]MEC2303596.1 aminopeptidase P family protein [Weizmannia sp. CD-2023]MEC2340496.1 aminopeptidase P family protein [Weizmannia sp. CD-2023]